MVLILIDISITLPLNLYLYPDLKRHNQNTTRTPSPYLRKHVTLYMNHTLTNIEKEINSYLFPCLPQLRWKSHRLPSHRHAPYFIGNSLQVFPHQHTPYFIGSSSQVLLHRHTPCFIGSSLQVSLHRPSPAIGNHLYKLAFIGYQSIQ